MNNEVRMPVCRLGVLAFLALCCPTQSAKLNADTADGHKSDAAKSVEVEGELADPVRLEADGAPIDIGKLSSIAHAGPWIADVDEDGDRDLLVGDFPGFFWFFENTGNDSTPKYTSQGKLQAGDTAAKTPVY